MNTEPLLNFIKATIPHFKLDEQGLLKTAECFEELELEKGEFLVKIGKPSGYFIMLEGYLRAYTFNEEGEEITTYFFPANRVVFEVASFFQGLPSEENIIALTKCKGFYTSFGKLNGIFHAVPEFREFGRAVLVKEFVAYKQRTLSMINKTAEERYAQLIQTNRDIFQYAQLKHIASYLGITDTSLSRVRREFSSK
ncbi:MAG: Crp/Fnr family transcriptional regulator [Bacteroidota bacterium]